MRLLRRPIACALLVWYLPACAYSTRIEPATAVAGRKSALVTVASGADTLVWQVAQPWIRNDTLGGVAAACQKGCPPQDARWPVPLSEVVEVRAVPPDVSGKATAAVLGTALLVGLVVLAAAVSDLSYGF